MIQLPILFEDGEALVIDKPAGLPIDPPRDGGLALENYLEALKLGFQRVPVAVHRLDRDTSGCLLLARNPKALKLGFQRLPIAVHRLDHDTSGCLLLARNPKAHKRFQAAFEARTVEKVYLGIVAGPVAGEHGLIELALTKISSAEAGWRMIPAKKGKPAVTQWRKQAERDGLTLIEFRPETGRTHQIRVHALAGLGHALLGDPVYGTGQGAPRTMLHALSLVVPREGKPPIDAQAPLSADFLGLDLFNAAGS